MARIAFTSNLQRHLSCTTEDAAGNTVNTLLERVFERNPRLRSYILDDQGRLRRHVHIYVNDVRISDLVHLTDPVGDDDEVFVFQALTGG